MPLTSFSSLCTVLLLAAAAVTALEQPPLFATKSAYWNQRSTSAHEASATYTLVQIQQVNRHGSRFPTIDSMQEIMTLLSKLQTMAAQYDEMPSWIATYQLPYNVSIEGALAVTGQAELRAFGQRTRQFIATNPLFPPSFDRTKYAFTHTFKERAKQSAMAFVDGFLVNPQDVEYHANSNTSDRVLRFFDECGRYQRDVKKNASAKHEAKQFEETALMQMALTRFKENLHVPEFANITMTDLQAAYTACAIDVALYNAKDHWCTLLDEEMLPILEYMDDLKSFYKIGGGYRINYEIATPLLHDIVDQMDAIVAKRSAVVGHFRFAHAETTLPLATLIGFGDRGTQLSSNVTLDQLKKEERGFRTSILAPFAANLEFRLFQKQKKYHAHCGEDAGDEYVVQVLLNERIAPVPGCDGRVYCPLTRIKQLWKYYLTTYDFDHECI